MRNRETLFPMKAIYPVPAIVLVPPTPPTTTRRIGGSAFLNYSGLFSSITPTATTLVSTGKMAFVRGSSSEMISDSRKRVLHSYCRPTKLKKYQKNEAKPGLSQASESPSETGLSLRFAVFCKGNKFITHHHNRKEPVLRHIQSVLR